MLGAGVMAKPDLQLQFGNIFPEEQVLDAKSCLDLHGLWDIIIKMENSIVDIKLAYILKKYVRNVG